MTATRIVDLRSFQDNLRHIAEVMSPARVMAVVKADAYGHGLIECAKAAVAAGIDFLGVLDIETGLELRKAEVYEPAFAWLHSPQSDFASAVRQGIELSVSSLAELELIAKTDGRAQVHLKIDTGLSRNGCRPEDWEALVTEAMSLDSAGEIDVVAIWSHLSGTSEVEDYKSLNRFEEAGEIARNLGFKGFRHIASSPAAFNVPASRYDLVRIGVSAFGTSPTEKPTASELGLKKPMRVTAEVLAPGVISIGFLHGYLSRLAGKAWVEIGGSRFGVEKIGPLASTIEVGNYSVGDEVLIFGDEGRIAPTAEQLCELVGTVTDELFTGLKPNLTTYTPID
jgi:alanine racemase